MAIRPITDVMQRARNGTLTPDASEKLAELVKRVDQSGKPGSLTITISLRKGPAGSIAVEGDVKLKLPKEEKVETLMFPTPEGNLLTEDPAQGKLDLKQVTSNNTELAVVAPASTEIKVV